MPAGTATDRARVFVISKISTNAGAGIRIALREGGVMHSSLGCHPDVVSRG
jgi:hypothetical protein